MPRKYWKEVANASSAVAAHIIFEWGNDVIRDAFETVLKIKQGKKLKPEDDEMMEVVFHTVDKQCEWHGLYPKRITANEAIDFVFRVGCIAVEAAGYACLDAEGGTDG